MLEETTWEAYSDAGMLSLEQQLPQLRSRDDFYPLEKHSPPRLLQTIEPSVFEWKTVHFAGIFVYIDATAFQRLKGLETGQPCRFLRQSEMTQMHDLVVSHGEDHPQLVDAKTFHSVHHGPLQWASINTLSREAFNWYIGPQLTLGEEQLLDAFRAGLPRFNEDIPNTIPGHPELRATLSQLPNSDWDWIEMLQPVRWFMCLCAFTGEHHVQCQDWQGICCNLICRHGPNTTLVYVRTICTHKWNGNVCPKGLDYKFIHGVAVTEKGIASYISPPHPRTVRD